MVGGVLAEIDGDPDPINEPTVNSIPGYGLDSATLSVNERYVNWLGNDDKRVLRTDVTIERLQERNRTKIERSNFNIETQGEYILRIDKNHKLELVKMDKIGLKTEENLEKSIFQSRFWIIEDGFVITDKTNPDVIFKIVSEMANCEVERVTFDIQKLIDQSIGGDIWSFSETKPRQVGLEIEYGPHRMKIMVTSSGYVEVYQPINYSRMDFMQFMCDKLHQFRIRH